MHILNPIFDTREETH